MKQKLLNLIGEMELPNEEAMDNLKMISENIFSPIMVAVYSYLYGMMNR